MLKEASLAATKEKESGHPLLRGAGNTAEGFEVHRANILQSSSSLIFALQAKIQSFFLKDHIDQSYKIYKCIIIFKP